jgi:hypothetical protein
VLRKMGRTLTGRLGTPLNRYVVVLLLIASSAGGALAWTVLASAKPRADGGRVITLGDGSVLSVDGSVKNGFAREIQCNASDICRPFSHSSTGLGRGFEPYILVGTVKRGSDLAGVFGFRIGGRFAKPTYFGCTKTDHGAYRCDPTGHTLASHQIAIYVRN